MGYWETAGMMIIIMAIIFIVVMAIIVTDTRLQAEDKITGGMNLTEFNMTKWKNDMGINCTIIDHSTGENGCMIR